MFYNRNLAINVEQLLTIFLQPMIPVSLSPNLTHSEPCWPSCA